MRITIETDGTDSLSVAQDGHVQALDPPTSAETADGGSPPLELVELLTGQSDYDRAETEGDDEDYSFGPEDAGAAPDWLVDVIEGQSASGSTEISEN